MSFELVVVIANSNRSGLLGQTLVSLLDNYYFLKRINFDAKLKILVIGKINDYSKNLFFKKFTNLFHSFDFKSTTDNFLEYNSGNVDLMILECGDILNRSCLARLQASKTENISCLQPEYYGEFGINRSLYKICKSDSDFYYYQKCSDFINILNRYILGNKLISTSISVSKTCIFRRVEEKKIFPNKENLNYIPFWLKRDILRISTLDPTFIPINENYSHVGFYEGLVNSVLPNTLPSLIKVAISKLRKVISPFNPSHVFIVPWLKRGGLDLGIISYVKAAIELGARPIVIATELVESEWSIHLPKECLFLSLPAVIPGSIEFHRDVLINFLIELNAECIHIINSRTGWETVRSLRYIENKCWTKLIATVVCDDYTDTGLPISYARYFLPSTVDIFDAVISDCAYYLNVLENDLGLLSQNMQVIKFPTKIPSDSVPFNYKASKKILWAGRLDRQKRPDILLSIARKLPDYSFHVYGSTLLDGSDDVLNSLSYLANVTLHGAYEGFSSLDHNSYDLFLYTSSWDGLPNVLLEATAHGLPIVCSIVGGIGEFIDETTGFPVYDIENIDKYASSIELCSNNRNNSFSRWENAFHKVRLQHSWDSFLMNVNLSQVYS